MRMRCNCLIIKVILTEFSQDSKGFLKDSPSFSFLSFSVIAFPYLVFYNKHHESAFMEKKKEGIVIHETLYYASW